MPRAPRFVPRERDEEVLEWLHLRLERGWSWPAIARAYGKRNYTSVQSAVQAVLDEMQD